MFNYLTNRKYELYKYNAFLENYKSLIKIRYHYQQLMCEFDSYLKKLNENVLQYSIEVMVDECPIEVRTFGRCSIKRYNDYYNVTCMRDDGTLYPDRFYYNYGLKMDVDDDEEIINTFIDKFNKNDGIKLKLKDSKYYSVIVYNGGHPAIGEDCIFIPKHRVQSMSYDKDEKIFLYDEHNPTVDVKKDIEEYIKETDRIFNEYQKYFFDRYYLIFTNPKFSSFSNLDRVSLADVERTITFKEFCKNGYCEL